MRKIVEFFLLLVLVAGLGACASGIKAYQKGNYLTACEEAVSKLRSKPDHEDARYALSNGYPLALSTAQREIDNLSMNMNSANAERVILLYERLNKLADNIYRCPAALELIPQPVEFQREVIDAKNKIAQIAYDEGIVAMDRNTIDQARIAFDCFTLANRYVPGYRDVLNKIEEARYAATLRVIVMNPLLPNRYQLDANFFYTQLMQDVTRNTYRRLVRFYTPDEATALNMNDPHQLLVLNFEDFVVGDTKTSSNTTELKRDNVVVGTTTVNGVKQDVYGTVQVKYTLSRIEIISGGVLSIKIIDPPTGRILYQKNLQGSTVWKSERASFNGDERALSDRQKALVGRRQETPPPPQELFSSFAGPLYADAMKFISSVY